MNPNPGFSLTDKPQEVILGFGTEGYFDRMAELMCKVAPPAAEDAPMLAEMAKIGLVPGKDFDLRRARPRVAGGTPDPATDGAEKNRRQPALLGVELNGWTVTKGVGTYGTDYMKRAVVAAFGWPANLQQDAVYPYTERRRGRPEADGRAQVHADLPQGPDAAGQRLLVDHHV